MEIWRDIDGFDGLYQVSNLGRVKSFHHGERILKVWLRSGYPQVGLHRGGKSEKMPVHRLVAEAFIPNPESKPEVNHLNGNRVDNRVENLEWATHIENIQHAVATGLKKAGADHVQAKFTNEQIVYIRDNPDGLTGKKLARMFGVHQMTISDVQCGKHYKRAGGQIRKVKPQVSRVPDNIRDEIKRLYVFGSQEFGTRALARKFNLGATTILNIVREN